MEANITNRLTMRGPIQANTALLIQPFTFAVNLQAGAIDEEMEGFLATDRLWQNGQTATPAAQRGVIGDHYCPE
jgi:hypothetical protein